MSRRPPVLPTILLVAAATLAACVLAIAAGIPWMTPVLTALPGCAALWRGLSSGSRARALALTLTWTVTLGLAMTWLGAARNEQAARSVPMGPAYRDEMRAWIATGSGRESEPARFIPQHLTHAALFAAASLATAGAAGLVMGAALMGYMSFYVGDLAHAGFAACSPARVALVAWVPWALVRVIAFVTLGVVLAEPLMTLLTGRRFPPGRRWWIGAGLAGLVVDVALKAALAPHWRTMLAACAG